MERWLQQLGEVGRAVVPWWDPLTRVPSETIGALSHWPIVLTDTIDYRTIGFSHNRSNPNHIVYKRQQQTVICCNCIRGSMMTDVLLIYLSTTYDIDNFRNFIHPTHNIPYLHSPHQHSSPSFLTLHVNKCGLKLSRTLKTQLRKKLESKTLHFFNTY